MKVLQFPKKLAQSDSKRSFEEIEKEFDVFIDSSNRKSKVNFILLLIILVFSVILILKTI